MSPAAMRQWKPTPFPCPKCGKPVDWPNRGVMVGNVPQHVICPGTPMRRSKEAQR